MGRSCVVAPSIHGQQRPVPTAFIIPKAQRDTQALQRMLWTLQHGQVEIRTTTAPVTIDEWCDVSCGQLRGESHSAVWRLREKRLLERQALSEVSVRLSGRPAKTSLRRYGAHVATAVWRRRCHVATVAGGDECKSAIVAVSEPKYTVPGLSDSKAFVALAFIKSHADVMDEGWTRWMFDANRIPFTSVWSTRIWRAGKLNDRSLMSSSVAGSKRWCTNHARRGCELSGFTSGRIGRRRYCSAQCTFVQNGGTLLAFNAASGLCN